MGGENLGYQPSGAPLYLQQREEEHWRHFDNSVNAVSFGFVATAILISMFLIMAIFERFLRPRSTDIMASSGRNGSDLEAQVGFNGKLSYPSPKMSVYAKGVSVLMPGERIPTFIAHPAPAPCPPERILFPPHQHSPSTNPTSNTNTISSGQ
ncbi:Cttnbp 2 amino-terminal-like protein [Thalictrum thalictroides]|uniref:Cttnbp 2 amino-terminal-like protein n=1 Tax=Thalictrum thalictroides TaxID=46969 RepID=A0A7J6W3N0_THATH|nr:Cttnbp 2 amino-terminal-like protein [Thalictrum thalictroides]